MRGLRECHVGVADVFLVRAAGLGAFALGLGLDVLLKPSRQVVARRTVLVSIAELAKQVRLGAENVLVEGVWLATDGLALRRNSYKAPLGASRRPCQAVQ